MTADTDSELTVIRVYLDPNTACALRRAAADLNRSVEELAEAAVAEAALDYVKDRKS